MPPDPEWTSLVRALYAYSRRRFNADPEALSLHLRHHPHPTYEPLSLALIDAVPLADPRGQGAAWATGPDPKHTDDFSSVYWPGAGTFDLTPTQAAVVACLWNAAESGTHEVSQKDLLRTAESQAVRLVDVFKRSRAWGTLIVSTSLGFYRLPQLDSN